MEVQLVLVTEDEKEILRNLMEKYEYEFSQYELTDVNALGLYGYSYLDHYWTEEGRWAYFIKVNGQLAGFAMVNTFREADLETDYSMSEFFVMYKYRRSGVGRMAAEMAFRKHPGLWQLKYHPHNEISVHFWNRVVGDYTKGRYQKLEAYPDADYLDGTPATILVFNIEKT